MPCGCTAITPFVKCDINTNAIVLFTTREYFNLNSYMYPSATYIFLRRRLWIKNMRARRRGSSRAQGQSRQYTDDHIGEPCQRGSSGANSTHKQVRRIILPTLFEAAALVHSNGHRGIKILASETWLNIN